MSLKFCSRKISLETLETKKILGKDDVALTRTFPVCTPEHLTGNFITQNKNVCLLTYIVDMLTLAKNMNQSCVSNNYQACTEVNSTSRHD